MENAGRCWNSNERAQPLGSSWRSSRVAARLYCSNKSYHPAITAPITSPRDEYILACALYLSLSLLWTRFHVVRCSSISQRPRTEHFIRAIVPSNCLSLLLFLFLFLLASSLYPATDNEHDPFSFCFLSVDVTSSSVSWYLRDTRSDLFPCSTG